MAKWIGHLHLSQKNESKNLYLSLVFPYSAGFLDFLRVQMSSYQLFITDTLYSITIKYC